MATITNDSTSDVLASTADAEAAKPANIAPATAFSTSGAPVQLVPDVDPSHPAVDNDPRAGTTIKQNRIDFNDPTISGADAVAGKLGMKKDADAGADATVSAAPAKTKGDA